MECHLHLAFFSRKQQSRLGGLSSCLRASFFLRRASSSAYRIYREAIEKRKQGFKQLRSDV